jgi:hypothetical protein
MMMGKKQSYNNNRKLDLFEQRRLPASQDFERTFTSVNHKGSFDVKGWANSDAWFS